jgi:Chaperone of endosialidase
MKNGFSLLLFLLAACFVNAQSVGIGTTTPQATLDVKGNVRTGGINNFILYDSLSGKITWANSNLFVTAPQYLMKHSASAEGLYSNGAQLEYRNQVGNPIFFTNWTNGNGYFSGNLGIGTVSPTAKLQIRDGASGIAPFFSARMVVETNSHTYINLLSPDPFETGILFGSGTNAVSGLISYNSTTVPKGFIFNNNGNQTRMVINNTGQVGIGTTTPAFKLDVANGSINTDSVYRIGAITVLAAPGYANLFIGKDAGIVNTGFNNTFSGYQAGFSNTSGNSNSFFGDVAGYSNTSGNSNSFFGNIAGYSNTSGYGNSFFGDEAGYSNTSGSANSFFGGVAGSSNTSGYSNSFFGGVAGLLNTTGYYNTFSGNHAGFSNTSGNSNSFFGYGAGFNNITGGGNTAVGNLADFSTDALINATVIGSLAIVDASNKVRIGNTNVTSIGGQVGWTSFSDGRFKRQVQEDIQGLAFIKKLRPVSYQVDLTALNNYYSAGRPEILKSSSLQQNTNSQTPEFNRQSGFIAQEVEQAAKELGFSFSGIDKPQNEKALYGLRYGDFVVPLVKAVQEQQAMIEQQNTIIEQQNKKIEMLLKEINLIKEKLK